VQQNDWRNIVEASEVIHRAPIWIDDSAGLSAAAITQVAMAQRVTRGLDLLIVDHLGEVAGDAKDSMFEQVTKAGRALRDLAKSMNIPVLLMAQLNRKVEERADKRPQLSDLRQSGEIEQMARNVWFLFRRGYYLTDAAEDRDLQLIIAKQAHGKTGMLELNCNLSRMDVRDWEVDRDGPFPLYRPGAGARAAADTGRGTGSGERSGEKPGFFDRGDKY
jgi:replicative DNA helicase